MSLQNHFFLERALSLANNLTALWGSADEEGKREILAAIFVRFTVDNKRSIDTEVRPPYSWLMRWKPKEAPVSGSEKMLVYTPANI
jgi:hypothetical protein